MRNKIMDLQHFAGEEAAEAPVMAAETGAAVESPAEPMSFNVGDRMADGTTVANAQVAAALNRQMKRHPEMRQVYARNQAAQAQQQATPIQAQQQMPQGQPVQTPDNAAEGQPEADDRMKRWNEVKSEFKDLYGADIKARIDDRFKNQADATRQLQEVQPVLAMLMEQSGAKDLKELQDILKDSLSEKAQERLEEEAEEAGMTVEALKNYKQIQADNARYEAERESAMNRAHIEGLYAQCEELKKVYPDIDFFAEMQNEQFRQWTSPDVGMSFEQAYMALHGKDLQAQAMAYGMDRTRAQLGNTIQAQRARPGEGAMNGKSQAAAADPRMNPAAMSREERNRFKEYIRRTRKAVSFD